MIEVDSSNIEAIGHDVIIKFKNGSVYKYRDVDFDILEGLWAAESHGKYLNAVIKPHFEVERLA